MYKDIISKMTLEEKAGFLTGDKMHTRECKEYGIESVEMSDGPSGVHCVNKSAKKIDGGDVAFPCIAALAATWNTELVAETTRHMALNCLERGINLLLAPGVNIQRNPLCGRNYEYFSEDPYLSAEMGIAYINGLQENGVGACLKHFAVNNQENFRGVINAEVDERTLREIYLYAFEMIVKRANPATVMCAYNKVNGHYCSENKKLLTEILRNEWGYKGAVVSDWGAVHSVPKSINAGVDLVMPERKGIINEIETAVKNGTLSSEDVDRAVENVISIEQRIKNKKETFVRSAAHEAAAAAEREAIVLLKNENGILPLSCNKNTKIGVIGLFADKPQVSAGIYSSGAVTVEEKSIDSALECIKKYAGAENVLYEPLYSELCGSMDFDKMISIQNIAKESEILIMFAGNYKYWEIEGEDRDNLDLPRNMIRMIEECCRYCKKTVVITQTGSPFAPFMRHSAPSAHLQMWIGGEAAGEAIADVLFGKTNPSGKLPMTFMKKMNPDVETSYDGRYLSFRDGLFVGYRYYDMHKEMVWYPFGHGMSYTEFEYSDIKTEMNDKKGICVSFKIKNVGNVEGKEVCQLYVCPKESSVIRPLKELKGFKKVSLKSGEEKTVEIYLDERAFSYYNTNENDWHKESGKYEIAVGASSADIRLCTVVDIQNENDYTINRERWGDASRKELIAD